MGFVYPRPGEEGVPAGAPSGTYARHFGGGFWRGFFGGRCFSPRTGELPCGAGPGPPPASFRRSRKRFQICDSISALVSKLDYLSIPYRHVTSRFCFVGFLGAVFFVVFLGFVYLRPGVVPGWRGSPPGPNGGRFKIFWRGAFFGGVLFFT